ncbi:MAG TPA: hypothetical protein VH024_13315 [Candidatus Angelobacter sp.]|nr:hypothetical protein [Candidatus Angelobacter sp.]
MAPYCGGIAGGAADIAIGCGGGGAVAEAAADIAMGWESGGAGAGAAIAPG